MEIINNLEEIDILARTIYGGARGEYGRRDGGIAALSAVRNVVMNRLKAKTWYGKTITEICHKPFQFSCWNPQDPNRVLLMSSQIEQDRLFHLCHQVAESVATSQWPDLTHGSDHYYALTMSKPPAWSQQKKPKIQLGQHIFFKLASESSEERN